MKIRLTDWATRQGIASITAVRWAKAGKIPGLHRAVSGRLFVEVEADTVGDGVVLYGRVWSADLVEHRDRLGRFGTEYVEAALSATGRTVIVVNDGEERRNRRAIQFACVSCGRRAHADVVGAKNLLGRSEDNEVLRDDRPEEVGALLEGDLVRDEPVPRER